MASKFDEVADRADAAARRLDQRLSEWEEERRRIEQDDQRSQAQIDAQTKQDLQVRFQGVFEPYNEHAPMPAADDSPASYHKHLLRTVQRKLSPADDRRVPGTNSMTVGDVAKVPIAEMPRSAREAFDGLIHAAASLQAETPHVSTLPPAGDFATRHRTDEATGMKETRYYGRESFLKHLQCYRPGRKVQSIHTGRGNVFCGLK